MYMCLLFLSEPQCPPPLPLPGKKIKDERERESLIVTTLQSLGRWEEAAHRLTAMIEADPDCWFTVKAYINGQVERSLALYRERTSSDEQPGPPKEGESPVNEPTEGENPSSQTNDSVEDWLRPLVEARDLLERLADVELKKYESNDLCVRYPLLSRLELVQCVRHMPVPNVPLSLGNHTPFPPHSAVTTPPSSRYTL